MPVSDIIITPYPLPLSQLLTPLSLLYQVNHSSFTEWSGPVSCGCALLPLKTKVKGPAAPCPPDQSDIIDESLLFFRANVLFRNFQPKSPADLTLCYLTVFIGEVLRSFQKCKTKDEAKRSITQLSMSTSFAVPGEKSFALPGFFTVPASRSEGDAWRNYMRQAREETVNRLLELAYSTPPNVAGGAGGVSASDAPQNKWWMSFAKRKFMNITST